MLRRTLVLILALLAGGAVVGVAGAHDTAPPAAIRPYLSSPPAKQ